MFCACDLPPPAGWRITWEWHAPCRNSAFFDPYKERSAPFYVPLSRHDVVHWHGDVWAVERSSRAKADLRPAGCSTRKSDVQDMCVQLMKVERFPCINLSLYAPVLSPRDAFRFPLPSALINHYFLCLMPAPFARDSGNMPVRGESREGGRSARGVEIKRGCF